MSTIIHRSLSKELPNALSVSLSNKTHFAKHKPLPAPTIANNLSSEPCYDLDRLVNGALSDAHKSGTLNQVKKRDAVEGVVRLFKPRMDLHEDTEKNMVTATFELPGVSKDDIEIDIHNGRLTVSAETKQKVDGYLGKFSRAIHLPESIKEDEIKAFWNNGILTIAFPKTTPEPAAQCISIF